MTNVTLPEFHTFIEDDRKHVQQKLLHWYSENKRSLPWRDVKLAKNIQNLAYRVLVSEIMLQQTQVNTVVKYYNDWMERWPTISDLAKADSEDVQMMWKGLGYYSRAERLLKLARNVCADNGLLPESVKGLTELPGIGRYTAGAVASIAFDSNSAAVDGNVIRVLTRLRAIGGVSSSGIVTNVIWTLAESLVPTTRPGDWNQALMELGATVCLPRKPMCSSCPLQSHCHASQQTVHDLEDCSLCLPNRDSALITDFPRKLPKKKARDQVNVVCIFCKKLENSSEFLVAKRNSQGLLADLWQFPEITLTSGSSLVSKAAVIKLKADFGLTGRLTQRLIGDVSHKFSHISMTYSIIVATGIKASKVKIPKGYCSARWITEEQWHDLPVSTAMKKVYELLVKSA